MTIGDDGIASICMGKAHDGDPCERCGHHGPHSRDSEERELALWLSAHHVAFTAKCVDCSTVEQLNAGDRQEAARGFYESGWRVRGGRMRCKAHAAPLLHEGTRYLKKDMGVWLD